MVPGVSIGTLDAAITWLRLLLRVALVGMVGYVIVTQGRRVAVWLGDSRPIRYVVYAQLSLVVIGILLGTVDGLTASVFGDRLTVWGFDALAAILRRIGL